MSLLIGFLLINIVIGDFLGNLTLLRRAFLLVGATGPLLGLLLIRLRFCGHIGL